ncbi:hypothetical protein QR680_003798 [Steinernema hermaphroditum]|uniref:Uncharacterized protein n=1 Tax=Steinernema hermaphroditum TaxID=289476 RepID=A0AA39HMZ4_9BILA|nr:hypothetical protein QR680_003798 [Steinernema hermaphroditum]
MNFIATEFDAKIFLMVLTLPAIALLCVLFAKRAFYRKQEKGHELPQYCQTNILGLNQRQDKVHMIPQPQEKPQELPPLKEEKKPLMQFQNVTVVDMDPEDSSTWDVISL